MPDTFSAEQIRDIIYDNLELAQSRHGDSQYSQDMINKIFEIINSCNSLPEGRERTIKRAAYVFALITNFQPFSDFNRHSAYSSAVTFLRFNNLDLSIDTNDDERILFELLDRTKGKKEDDPTLCSEFENYLTSKVKDRMIKRFY